jgi:hypothetical protein
MAVQIHTDIINHSLTAIKIHTDIISRSLIVVKINTGMVSHGVNDMKNSEELKMLDVGVLFCFF